MEESSNNSRTSVDNRKAFSALPQTVDRLNGKMVSSVRTIRIVHANGALRDIESLLFIFLSISVLPPLLLPFSFFLSSFRKLSSANWKNYILSPIIYPFGERMLIIPVSEFGNQAMIKPNYERIICPRKQNTIRPINRLLGWIRTLCFRFVSSAARVGKCFIGMRWALGREMKSRS